ncbi:MULTISPECIES: hypothetical protein [Streptomyces]|uniref:hypothetical protein n=1 Tax=Streptomyces TaxID=1883 RepID=UPI001F516683|nr:MULTISPECIES: hypothetical protein [unclassified Streptomyces]
MLGSKLARAVAVAATAVTVLSASAYPAVALEEDGVGVLGNKTLDIGSGTMTFIDDGDVFKICDTVKDGEGVYGALFYNSYVKPNGWDRVMKVADGGDASCGKSRTTSETAANTSWPSALEGIRPAS